MRGEAYGRELLNAADRQRGRHFSSGQQPSNMPVRHQCSALRSGIALPPDCTAYLATGWSTFGSSCGSSCGSSASSHLTGCWTTRAAEWPPASRSLRQTGAHRSRNALPPICTTADNLAPRAGYRRSEQASGQHVISNCPGRHYYSTGCFKARSCETVDRMWHMAPDTERVTAGIVARSIPSVLERYVAPAQHPRHRLHPTYAEGFCVHGQRLRSQTHINSFGPFIATHRCEDRRIPESTLPSEPRVRGA